MNMTLKEFQNRFPDEKACRKFLFSRRWPKGFQCPHCDHTAYYYIKTRNLYECAICRSQTSLTAGTVMHRTRLPLHYWFLTFFIVTSGQPYSARWLATTLRLNYRTALRMLNAVRRTMRKENGSHLLAGVFQSHTDPSPAVTRARRIMIKKAARFIRSTYRRIHPASFQNYIDEFYFHWFNRFNRQSQFLPLLIAATSQFTTAATAGVPPTPSCDGRGIGF
ncbi:MAG: transposase [Bacillaceae bacterium]|nr:transposase [Bacillaceae bacterium]